MGIKVNIHPLFYRYTNNQEIAEVNGSTVGECLDDLIKQLPGLEGWLLIEGKLLNYIDIYVNRESVYPEGLNKPVKDGDELLVIPMLGAGG